MSFTPRQSLSVDSPEQLKAFTDPLRIRVLVALAEGAATNQQLADALGEPQANVLYHLRFLLKVGLIELVETKIKGGNVEKYYRAVARTFELKLPPELRPSVAGAEFGALAQEVSSSAAAWPDQPPRFVIRPRYASPEAAARFFERLIAFANAYWDDPRNETVGARDESGEDPLYYFAALVFRGARGELVEELQDITTEGVESGEMALTAASSVQQAPSEQPTAPKAETQKRKEHKDRKGHKGGKRQKARKEREDPGGR